MKRNMQEWLTAVINGKQRNVMPVLSQVGAALVGKQVRDITMDGVAHACALEALIARYPMDAVITQMDLSVEAEAFGAEISGSGGGIPYVKHRLPYTDSEFESLALPSIDDGRLPEYLKASRRIAAISSVPVFSGCIGPLTLAASLYGFSEMKELVAGNSVLAKILLQKCTAFLKEYGKALKGAGSNGLFVAEPVAGLLDNRSCWEYSSVYVRQMVDSLQDDYFMVILHNCGNRGQCTDAMVRSGSAGLHFGNAADMVEALQHCPADRLVMGNVDPISILKKSSAEEVYQSVSGLLYLTSGFPNFVLSTGCDTPMGVPPENIDRFFAAVEDFNHRV